MEKSEYSKKLNERKKSDDSKNKSMVKTGCYKKDEKYYVVFYTGIKDFKVKDYVKLLGGRYRPDLIHVDEDGKTLSDKKCHGWLVDPEILKVEHLNNLIEYGADNESLLKSLQSKNIDYDPDRPKKSPERQTMTLSPKNVNHESETKNVNNSKEITIHIKNSSNEIVSTIKCSILSKINEFNYITDIGEIFKTSSGWQFVSSPKMWIEFSVNTTVNNKETKQGDIKESSNQMSIPKEAIFLGGLTNAYSELKNLVLNSESPDCEDDD